MTIRKERRRLEKRLKRTQYTQKSITMATTLVAGSTFIPTLGHAAETATTETSNDLKVVEQTTNTTPETDSTPVVKLMMNDEKGAVVIRNGNIILSLGSK